MFKDDYKATFSQVTASQETYRRVMNMTKKNKKSHGMGFVGKALIAAVIVSLLAVTASAAERIGIWFTQYWGGDEKLSQEQVQFVEDNTQKLPTAPSPGKNADATHTDVLEFVKNGTDEGITCQVDMNNSHVTGQGDPNFCDVQVYSLRLTNKRAVLKVRYKQGMNYDAPCSISDICLILKNGKEITLPITDSSRGTMYFEAKDTVPLADVEQVRLPDGTQLKPANLADDGYSLSLDSVLTDGPSIYFTLNLTMPENIPSPGEGWSMDGNPHGTNMYLFPAELEEPTDEWLYLWYYGAGGGSIDDGDGKDSTRKLVVNFTPNDEASRFEPGSKWKLHVDGLEAIWQNEENRDALFNGKYAGQDVMLEDDEVDQTVRWEQLCYDTWEFIITLDGKPENGAKEVEFVTDPITLSCYRGAELSELMKDPNTERYGPYDIQLVSFRISPLSYYIEYAADADINLNMVDPGEYILRMKDGSEQSLFQYSGRQQFAQPVILENIDYLLLPNGQKLTMPN